MEMLWWLIILHAVCDFPLQGDFLAKGKNHRAPLAGVPWWVCLWAHAVIHGGAVALATGSVVLGVAEVVVHAAVDWAKCDGLYGFTADQAFHIAWKAVWVLLVLAGR